MRRFNKKALTAVRAERICTCLFLLPECWTLWIQVMLPIDACASKPERIVVFNLVHLVHNVMGNERLQLAHKTTKNAHFDNGHESGLLQSPDMAGDRGEVVIDGGQAVIRPEFSSNMVLSQVCLQTGEFGQGLRRVDARRLPVHLIAATQARSAANLKLGHYLGLDTLYKKAGERSLLPLFLTWGVGPEIYASEQGSLSRPFPKPFCSANRAPKRAGSG